MSHPIPEDAQRLALRLRLLADEVESAARYGVPIPYCVSVTGAEYGGVNISMTEDEFTAWAEYVEAEVTHDRHHGADWSNAAANIGDADRLPLRFHVRHEAEQVTA
jgi:hypothetical protein